MNHPFVELDDQHGITDCRQCGYTYEFNRRQLSPDRVNQGAWYLCKSCKAVPTEKCWYGDDWCKPWQGEFDLDWLICLDDNGKPYMLGPRTCGHWDCVRTDHLISR